MKKLFESIVTWVNLKFGKDKEMIPPFVMTYAANFLLDLVKDPLQNLAKEHIEKAMDKAPKELKDALDKAVDEDASHGHKSLMDLIK
jgi:hypothetical protein